MIILDGRQHNSIIVIIVRLYSIGSQSLVSEGHLGTFMVIRVRPGIQVGLVVLITLLHSLISSFSINLYCSFISILKLALFSSLHLVN